MGIVWRILGGLVLIGIGVVFIKYTEWFLKNIGRNNWAEVKLGGTRNMYKLLGIICIFLGLMAMTGMLGGALVGTIGRLFVPPGA